MPLSKSTRIIILLTIDSAFFFTELVIGYMIHSLALIADAFHMLNDVLSLCVGLWAVKVATNRTSSRMYTYGWQRAETLGALVNGVFLVALCVTIFLDAISRFVEPQEVTNPRLMLIVGCLGLGSNILGLALFHDHGHGGHSHGHSHGGAQEHSHKNEDIAAEEGLAHGASHERQDHENLSARDAAPQIASGESSESVVAADRLRSTSSTAARHSKTGSASRPRGRAYSGIDDIHINPNAFRQSIIEASRISPVDPDNEENGVENTPAEQHTHVPKGVQEPLLSANRQKSYGTTTLQQRRFIDHAHHNHSQPKQPGKGHGHSHGDLNMQGIFLHVMGDALGNIGVIATALIIWLTNHQWRFYFDPAISLVITAIILASAIPLCKAASRILLQAVPAGIDVDEIKADIDDLPGIVSCHHLHVWQLSDTKLIASLHIQVEFDFQHEGSARYMELAQAIRKCLHDYGIHSSTIQPEFCLDPAHDHTSDAGASTPGGSQAGSVRDPDPCLLECSEGCEGAKSCCPPPAEPPE